MTVPESRARIDRRDELATAIREAVEGTPGVIRYDEDDWTRMADRLLPMIGDALREVADEIEATDSQKGIASRALAPGKAFAVAWLRDRGDQIARDAEAEDPS